MDGMNYFQNQANEPTDDLAPPHPIRRAVLVTVASVVLTLSVLVGLRMADAPPLLADEIANAPIAW